MLVAFAAVAFPAVAFSADTVVATIRVGDGPVAVAVDPVAHHVYVANYNADTVSVIDGVSDAVVATVPMPVRSSAAFPIAVVADPLSGKAYAGTFWSDYVSVIGPGLSAIATISPPLSHGSGVRALALDPSGPTTKVYAAIYGKNAVSVIDGATDSAVATIAVGSTPRALAVFSSGPRRRVYVANRYSNDVSVIDGATDSVVATVPTGAGPKVIAVDPDRGFAYVTSPASDTVTVIDDHDAAAATIAVGDNPIGVAVDSTRRRVFVADYAQNAVTVIDADTLAVVGTVITQVQPYAVAVDRSAGKVFVTCYGGAAATIIDPVTLAAVDVPVGTNPYALAIDEGLATHKTFVGNWGSDDVSVIDPAESGSGPVTVTVDPLPGDATSAVSPVLTGTATSTRAPLASSIVAVFYRADSDQAWHRAVITEGAGTSAVRWRTAPLGTLSLGAHRIEVAAMDQALACSSSSDQGAGGASAALGAPVAYGFSIASTSVPVTHATVEPASPDGDAGWYLTQPVVTLAAEPVAPTYYGWDAPAALPYGGPLAAPAGAHVLAYRSGSEAGGFEATATLALSYDPAIPVGPLLTDITHVPGFWSKDAAVALSVSGASDGDSGLAGFSAVWSAEPGVVPGGSYELGPLTSSLSTSLPEGSWYVGVRARDVAGNVGTVVRSGPYLIDLTAPETSARVTLADGTGTVSLTATDALSGVLAIRYRVDGGQWVEGASVSVGPGEHMVEYASVDRAGNEERTGSITFTVIARYEETEPSIARVGRWSALTDPRLSAGACIRTERRSAYVEARFVGTSVGWVSPKGPTYGKARVIVDGASGVTVDLYSASPTYGQTVWGASGLAAGPHTIRIECTGTKNRASKGSFVALDALDLDGALAVQVLSRRLR